MAAAAPGPRSAPRRPVVEVVDDETARILSRKTGAERLAIAAGMFRSARRMIESHLRAEHPEWDPQRLQAEVARRLSHGAVRPRSTATTSPPGPSGSASSKSGS